MTTRPTFSVVTISYRDLEGLKRTVDSVRAQRYDGDIEHIVIDGGSGDEVVEFLSTCEPGFTYWQSQPDRGRYDAMNQGIAKASGDLVWLMHSADCFSDADAVNAVADAIAGQGPARELWGYGAANRVDASGTVINLWRSIPFDLVKFATARLPIPHQATFIGSALCRQLGGYDLDFGISADQLYILRAALASSPVTVDRVVCDFDVTGAGSKLAISDIFENFRRAYDTLDYYPLGSRRKSLQYLRLRELQLRSLHAAHTTAFSARSLMRRPAP